MDEMRKLIIFFCITSHVVDIFMEDKPLNRTYFDENLQKYWINLSEHGKTYDFYDSKDIVSAFLTVFDNNFIPRQNLRKIR